MNTSNINVNKYAISRMFDSEKYIYEIPKYQREYIWSGREWEALFDDLTENEKGHFLGSVICISSTSDTLSPRFEVVDGQQRLTTISILFAALYKALNEYKDALDEDQQADVLQLKRKIVLKNTDSGIRVVPQIQGNNREDYLGLLSKVGILSPRPSPKYAGNRKIEKAYKYFTKRINALLDEKTESSDKIGVLFDILGKVNTAFLVMIEVQSHADAYTLFESLNNRGTPLTAIDLIKTNLLARLDAKAREAHNEDGIDDYFKRWLAILNFLGDDYATQERFFRQNYNAFRKELNAPFSKGDRLYPLGTLATRSNMLDIYEKIINKDPVAALDNLYANAELYAEILLNKSDHLTDEFKESYLGLQRVQGSPAYMFILYLLKYRDTLQLRERDIIDICKLLVNFFIRRSVTDTPPTRDLTRIFMSFIEDIEQENYCGKIIYDSLYNILKKRSAPDDIFRQKLYGNIYEENADATRFILCMLEQRGMTRENEKDLWQKTKSNQYVWSIEHIMPQGYNIPESWVEMIADGDSDKAREYQDAYVHTLGNLTLTRYNPTLGNKSFAEKRDRKDAKGNSIGYKNGLKLNDDVRDKDTWSVDCIKARTKRMVEEIMTMFAL